YGWRYYGGKHFESTWTKFFQAYYLPEKFGFDKRKAHLSSLIAANQITREEALEVLSEPLYDYDELQKDKQIVMRQLDISELELDRLLQLPNNSYQNFPNQERIMKVGRRIKRLIGL